MPEDFAGEFRRIPPRIRHSMVKGLFVRRRKKYRAQKFLAPFQNIKNNPDFG
jgi:hypothetical protein